MGGKLNIEMGKNTVDVTVGSNSCTYYDCRAILFHLFAQYSTQPEPKFVMYMLGIPGGLFALVFAALPLFGMLDNGVSWNLIDPIEYIMLVLMYIMIVLVFLGGFVGFALALRDYERIDWTLEQLSQMYSVTKRSEI